MKKRTKTILLAAIVVIAFLALLAFAAVRKPSLGPDIALVKGVEPFSYETTVMTVGDPEILERVYVIRMDFDDAISQVSKELKGPTWKSESTEIEAIYTTASNDEYVDIERGLRIPGIVRPGGSWTTDEGATMIANPNPDPRGWITIVTFRHMHGLTLDVASFRKFIHIPSKGGPTEYTNLEPKLLHYGPGGWRETNECYVTWYGAHGRTGTRVHRS